MAMSEHADDRHWFISRDGKRYGPYTFAALAEAAAKGVIDGETSVWCLGWVRWHPAWRVPGLFEDAAEPEDDEADADAEADADIEGEGDEDASHDLEPGNVPPLAEELPPAVRSNDVVRLRAQRRTFADIPPGLSPDSPANDAAPRDAPPLVVEAPLAERANGGGLVAIRDLAPRQHDRLAADRRAAPQSGRFLRRAAIGVAVVLLVVGAGWGIFRSGLIKVVEPRTPAQRVAVKPPQPGPAPQVQAAVGRLPDTVATLPAVEALAAHDPAAFERFTKSFIASAANAAEDEYMSLARAALRKSVKRALANAPDDTLLEITDTYLAYMKQLNLADPESCVALSDESKGAKLLANLAKDYPMLFVRDMSVLDQVASTDPSVAVTPLTADAARPYLETVFGVLRQQSVRTDLLGRDKLTPDEFKPYCMLVVAFYEAVLAMPRADKIKLLRYLYATAAADPNDAPK
jgi:hypothetical protein